MNVSSVGKTAVTEVKSMEVKLVIHIENYFYYCNHYMLVIKLLLLLSDEEK